MIQHEGAIIPLNNGGQAQRPTKPSLMGAAGSVSFATLISRLLGVAREMVMANYFGAGLYTDAFNIAFRIPNLLRDLFAEGALSSAFVPTFVRCLTKDGREAAWLLANKVINALVILLAAITLLIFFGARVFVYLLAAGYAQIPEKFALTVAMTRIMSPFLLWIALAAVMMGMLNAWGSFFIPATASSAFNICCILAGIFLSPFMPLWGLTPVVSMAIGALIGGISQFAVQVPSAYRLGFRYRLVLDLEDPDLRRIAKLMLPAVVGLSATQINITVDNQLASLYGNGPVSWLNYAFRLMHLPIGIFGIAIATATLSAVSYHAAQNALDKLNQTVASSLRLAACLTFPATVGLILFRSEIVRLLYQRHSFLPSDTLQTSRVLLLYALGLFGYSAVKIVVPAFYALNDAKTPLRTSMLTIAVKILLNFLFIIPLGFLGLALATSIASWLNMALLLRKMQYRTGMRWHWRELVVYAKIALASLAMGGLSALTFKICSSFLHPEHTLGLAVNLGISICIGAGSMLPLLSLFKVAEAAEIAAMVKRRLPGRA
jgi:putative peptidoglycan lipid II flippase